MIFFGALAIVTVIGCLWALSGSSRPSHAGLSSPSPTSQAAHSSVQLPSLEMALPKIGTDAGSAPALPFPKAGEGAVAMMGTGVVAESADEREVPIASMTKMMTAYLVLKAHPLTGDESGPTLHFTAADHTQWMWYSENDLSNVELVAGESLTERQLLEALLIPSADNVADWFAHWVSGTEARFVARMNATAVALGMHHTHYADASGVDPHTVSTAADQALLASADMRNPVFRSIVALRDVPFPVEGSIWNVNPALGVDGIIGIKSGFTQAASGCLATAAWRKVGGRSVLVIAVVTGQPLGLWQAADEDEDLISAAAAHLQLVSPFGSRVRAVTVMIPWSHEEATAALPDPVRLAGWGGLRFSGDLVGAHVTSQNLAHGWAPGCIVAELRLRTQYGPVERSPVELDRSIAPPPTGSVSAGSDLTLGVR